MITAFLLVATTLAPAAEPAQPAARALHALFETEWQRSLAEDPVFASYVGDRRKNAQWPDMSIDAIARRARSDDAAARALAAIDAAALSPEDQLNASLFADLLSVRQGAFKNRLWLLSLDQMGGVHQQQMLLEVLPFATVQDYDDWLARLRAYPALVDQHIALLRKGITEKFVQARVAVARVPAQIRAEIVDDPTTSGFYAPFTRMPADLSEADRARLAAAARAVIAEAVVPALRKWLAVVEQEYLPACSTRVGMSDKPGGKAAYAFLVRMHTTTTRPPKPSTPSACRRSRAFARQWRSKRSYSAFTAPSPSSSPRCAPIRNIS